MRGRDDRAATNQRAIDALYLARRRAVAECRGRLEPQSSSADLTLSDLLIDDSAETWDHLSVAYLRGEWPPARLN